MDIAEQLHKLKSLHEIGALSDEEFAQAKHAVLDGPPREPSKEAAKEPTSIRSHLLQPSSASPVPQPQEDRKQPGAPDATHTQPPLPYDPIAPRMAHLELGERHFYTFTVVPLNYKKGSFFPPQIPGWSPDGTRFFWHLTDRRLLIEPIQIGMLEAGVMKGLLALGKSSWLGKNTRDLKDFEAGLEQLDKMQGQWLAIPYTDIAQVEAQSALPQPMVAKVVFKNPAISPLFFHCYGASAGLGKLFGSVWPYTKEFVVVVAKLLGAGTAEG